MLLLMLPTTMLLVHHRIHPEEPPVPIQPMIEGLQKQQIMKDACCLLLGKGRYKQEIKLERWYARKQTEMMNSSIEVEKAETKREQRNREVMKERRLGKDILHLTLVNVITKRLRPRRQPGMPRSTFLIQRV